MAAEKMGISNPAAASEQPSERQFRQAGPSDMFSDVESAQSPLLQPQEHSNGVTDEDERTSTRTAHTITTSGLVGNSIATSELDRASLSQERLGSGIHAQHLQQLASAQPVSSFPRIADRSPSAPRNSRAVADDSDAAVQPPSSSTADGDEFDDFTSFVYQHLSQQPLLAMRQTSAPPPPPVGCGRALQAVSDAAMQHQPDSAPMVPPAAPRRQRWNRLHRSPPPSMRLISPGESTYSSPPPLPPVPGSFSGGRRAAEAILSLNLAAAAPNATLVQVCLQDHYSHELPHLHVQLHFSDATRSPWLQFDRISPTELQELICVVCAPRAPRGAHQRVRLHLHSSGRRAGRRPTAKETAAAMPRLTMRAADAAALSAVTCLICLEGFCEGDTLFVIPCDGLHMSHDACITRWLAQSNTCPSCRHQLPADGTPKDDLIPKLQEICAREIERICALAECGGQVADGCFECDAPEVRSIAGDFEDPYIESGTSMATDSKRGAPTPESFMRKPSRTFDGLRLAGQHAAHDEGAASATDANGSRISCDGSRVGEGGRGMEGSSGGDNGGGSGGDVDDGGADSGRDSRGPGGRSLAQRLSRLVRFSRRSAMQSSR